ncbi:spore cortex biosynthesis protein YabQ [Thermoflavimicrobium dichotomicum]|uniref:Spore cortex biosynthesis protein YabQ n=1 Tax=Thermoflavimicrobium dichotomicum TaxID=46223 RepID=A0A1I3QNR9_9BACL|nr:spore cortex biosynthesis protein YabQ [Thermoflavimicrobium dichotomicum]SFJ35748.1 spore cortex biosynthesis protein YabQ [Thermoflavimicrobium dichotomicum]
MTLQTQAFTMILMFCSGFLLGMILDAYQELKARFRLKGWTVSLIDLLYWIVCAWLVFSLLLWSNWGQLRFYIFIAILAGLFFYYQWLSKLVIQIIRVVFNSIEYLLRWIIALVRLLVWVPLVTLCSWIRNLFLILCKMVMRPILWIFKPIHRLFVPYIKKMSQLRDRWKKKWNQFKKKR